VFGWSPTGPINLQLQDLADYGNASTFAVPRNVLIFDVAPLSHAFETYPASERMYSLMNHELVHVMQSDVASEQDRRWRRFFLGKVVPQARNPETLLYNYLTVPRFTSPRWLLEGSAVFFETWLGGGLGRAQGGLISLRSDGPRERSERVSRAWVGVREGRGISQLRTM
jgi:hypothetical protein